MSIRKSLNLVAFTILEKAEGEHHAALNDLFKGRISYEDFDRWTKEQSGEDPKDIGPSQDQLDELAEFKAKLNGNRIKPG